MTRHLPLIILLTLTSCAHKPAPAVETPKPVIQAPVVVPQHPANWCDDATPCPVGFVCIANICSNPTPAPEPPACELATIYFDTDSAQLVGANVTAARSNADCLKNNGKRALLEGYCDERGTVEYNLALGTSRTDVVANYLAKVGIPRLRLDTVSYGEDRAVCSEHSESCWRQNRRVEFKVK